MTRWHIDCSCCAVSREVCLTIGSTSRVKGHAGNTPGQGPFLDLTLDVVDGVIREAAYETYQCPGAHACGKAICDLARGRTSAEAGDITHPVLMERVGPLPAHRRMCYGLALLALSDALEKMGGPM